MNAVTGCNLTLTTACRLHADRKKWTMNDWRVAVSHCDLNSVSWESHKEMNYDLMITAQWTRLKIHNVESLKIYCTHIQSQAIHFVCQKNIILFEWIQIFWKEREGKDIRHFVCYCWKSLGHKILITDSIGLFVLYMLHIFFIINKNYNENSNSSYMKHTFTIKLTNHENMSGFFRRVVSGCVVCYTKIQPVDNAFLSKSQYIKIYYTLTVSRKLKNKFLKIPINLDFFQNWILTSYFDEIDVNKSKFP